MNREKMESIVKMICDNIGMTGQPNERRAKIVHLTDVAMSMLTTSENKPLDSNLEPILDELISRKVEETQNKVHGYLKTETPEPFNFIDDE